MNNLNNSQWRLVTSQTPGSFESQMEICTNDGFIPHGTLVVTHSDRDTVWSILMVKLPIQSPPPDTSPTP